MTAIDAGANLDVKSDRLVDYLFVIKFNRENSRVAKLSPQIELRLPQTDLKDTEPPQGIEHFASLEPCIVQKKHLPAKFFVSLLTDVECTNHLAVSILFYVKKPDPNNESEVIYMPYSIVLTTHFLTTVDVYKTILVQLLDNISGANTNKLSTLLNEIFNFKTSAPISNSTVLSLNLMPTENILFLPPQEYLCLYPFQFLELTNLIALENIMLILNGLLFNSKVILLSDSSWKLTLCCIALCNLLKPFQIITTFIPHLPSKFQNVMHSPLPFFLGVKTNEYDYSTPDINIVFNIDSGNCQHDTKIPELPKQCTEKAIKHLQRALQHGNNNDHVFQHSSVPDSSWSQINARVQAIIFHFLTFLIRKMPFAMKFLRLYPKPDYKYIHSIFVEESVTSPEDLNFYSNLSNSLFMNLVEDIRNCKCKNMPFIQLSHAIKSVNHLDYPGSKQNIDILQNYFQEKSQNLYQYSTFIQQFDSSHLEKPDSLKFDPSIIPDGKCSHPKIKYYKKHFDLNFVNGCVDKKLHKDDNKIVDAVTFIDSIIAGNHSLCFVYHRFLVTHLHDIHFQRAFFKLLVEKFKQETVLDSRCFEILEAVLNGVIESLNVECHKYLTYRYILQVAPNIKMKSSNGMLHKFSFLLKSSAIQHLFSSEYIDYILSTTFQEALETVHETKLNLPIGSAELEAKFHLTTAMNGALLELKESQENEMLRMKVMEFVFEFLHGYVPSHILSDSLYDRSTSTINLSHATGQSGEDSNVAYLKINNEQYFGNQFLHMLIESLKKLKLSKNLIDNTNRTLTPLMASFIDDCKSQIDIYVKQKESIVVPKLELCSDEKVETELKCCCTIDKSMSSKGYLSITQKNLYFTGYRNDNGLPFFITLPLSSICASIVKKEQRSIYIFCANFLCYQFKENKNNFSKLLLAEKNLKKTSTLSSFPKDMRFTVPIESFKEFYSHNYQYESAYQLFDTVTPNQFVVTSYPSFILMPKNLKDDFLKGASKYFKNSHFPIIYNINEKSGKVFVRSGNIFSGKPNNLIEIFFKYLLNPETKNTETLKNDKFPSTFKANRPMTFIARKLHKHNSTHSSDMNSLMLKSSQVSIVCSIFSQQDTVHAIFSSIKYSRHLQQAISTDDQKAITFNINFPNESELDAILLQNFSINFMKWVEFEAYCLKISSIMINLNSKQSKNVLLFAKKDLPFDNIISCLVKICINPYCRTAKGFSDMILIEWMQYPVKALRVSPTSRYRERLSLSFMLFLDCLHQIMRLFPQYFQFNLAVLSYLATQHLNDDLSDFCLHEVPGENKSTLFESLQDKMQSEFRNDFYKPDNLIQIFIPYFNPDLIEIADFIIHHQSQKVQMKHFYSMPKHYSHSNMRIKDELNNQAFLVAKVNSQTTALFVRSKFEELCQLGSSMHIFSDQLNYFEENTCAYCEQPITFDFRPGQKCSHCSIKLHVGCIKVRNGLNTCFPLYTSDTNEINLQEADLELNVHRKSLVNDKKLKKIFVNVCDKKITIQGVSQKKIIYFDEIVKVNLKKLTVGYELEFIKSKGSSLKYNSTDERTEKWYTNILNILQQE